MRRAMTLVELLVVISLIVVLAILTIAFYPTLASSEVESRGAIMVQSWLNVAKYRALRDGAPRGVRFRLDGATVGNVTLPQCSTTAEYIEQPSDFWAGPGSKVQAVGSTVTLALAPGNSDFTSGMTATPELWPVQPSDSIEFNGGGLVYRITSVVDRTTVVIAPAYPTWRDASGNVVPMPPTNNYRILRQPQTSGSEVLKLPDGVVIDYAAMTKAGFTPALGPTGYFDVLFSPSGRVMQAPQKWVCLYVRAPVQGDELNVLRGKPTAVAVRSNSGSVEAYPVDVGINPYSLVR